MSEAITKVSGSDSSRNKSDKDREHATAEVHPEPHKSLYCIKP